MDVEVSFEPAEELVRIRARMLVSPEDNARSFVAFALSDRLKIERIAVTGADMDGADTSSGAADSLSMDSVDAKTRRFWVVNLVRLPRELRGELLHGLVLLSGSDLQSFAGNSRSRSFYKLLAHEIGHLWWHPSMHASRT